MVVLLVVVPMGMAFDLLHAHSYFLQGHKYQLGEQFLVRMPDHVFGMFEELGVPGFLRARRSRSAWKWVLMFFVIGSLESLLERQGDRHARPLETQDEPGSRHGGRRQSPIWRCAWSAGCR